MLIASMTTLPGRLSDLDSVLKSLIEQTNQLDLIKIYFQGEKNQFNSSIIHNFKNVEVEFVSDYAKSKSKYYYSLKEFPNDDIILVDDDLIFEEKFIESLVIGHSRQPNCVITNLYQFPFLDVIKENCLRFTMDLYYMEYKNKWLRSQSGYGTLIPNHILDNTEILDIDKGNNFFPTSDECWLYCNFVSNNIITYCPGIFNEKKDFIKKEIIYNNRLWSKNQYRSYINGDQIFKYLESCNINTNNLIYSDLDDLT